MHTITKAGEDGRTLPRRESLGRVHCSEFRSSVDTPRAIVLWQTLDNAIKTETPCYRPRSSQTTVRTKI